MPKALGVSETPATKVIALPGRTILDGDPRSPEFVPNPAGSYLAINWRIATFNTAIYPVWTR